MGLRNGMLAMPFEQRFFYDPQQNLFFINFESLWYATIPSYPAPWTIIRP
jgi:hypothetical protein